MIVYAAVAVFIVTYGLIATERVHRVAAALGGVAAMVVLGIINAESAFFSHETGVDWDVIFLLFGMMVIVGVLKQTGLFEFLALWAVKHSGGRPARLATLLILVTAALSPILDNVTTVLLVTPVTLSVCERLGLRPMPYLISLILAANVGGTSTLIADPPNIIVASRANLTFDDFLIHSLPLCLILLVVLIGLVRVLFRRDFRGRVDLDGLIEPPASAIPDRGLLYRCLAVLALVMLAFGLHTELHLDPSLVAMLGAGAMVVVSQTQTEAFLEEVEWSTLAFFMALFVLVGGLVEVGVIGALGTYAAELMGDNELAGVTGLMIGSAIVGGFVDNIPYTAAMVPIVEEMVAATPSSGADSPLWWALVFGADLGGNTTAVAAGANVVVLGLAAKAGHPISFWKFTRYGIVVTIVTLAVAWVYVALRYFVLA